MAKDQYVYAVARIRSKELSLLSGSVIEQLLGAKGYDECLQLLREKNWGDSDAEDAGAILAAEREKTWAAHRRAGEGPLCVRRVPVRQ